MNDYIYGIHAVVEALKAARSIDKIQLSKRLEKSQTDEIRQRARALNIPIQLVPPQALQKVTRKNHQGVIAFGSPVEFYKLEDIVPETFERGEIPFILILDGITDVRNFGAIVRTAEAVGVHAIVIPDKGGVRVNADAMKTSAGALNRMKICKTSDIVKTVKYLKLSGIHVYGASENASLSMLDAGYNKPIAIVMGDEGTGISHKVRAHIDDLIAIPMMGKIASLNVSVATALIMYEALKKRENN